MAEILPHNFSTHSEGERFMNRKLLSVSSLVAATSVILAACAQPSPAAPAQPQVVKETVVVEVQKEVEKVVEQTVVVEATAAPVEKAKVLRVNLGTYPDVIDPQKSSFVNEIAHLKLIYEGLTKLDEKLNTVPGAAEKWEYNADQSEVTFTLRKNLKYSDGSPLNAKRFEYSIIRNINPETAGEYGTITNEIAGAPEWQDNYAAAASESDEAKKKAAQEAAAKGEETVRASVQALDASGAACKDYEQADCLTLKVKMSKPAPYFHTVLGIWVGYPAKEENISEGGENWWNSSKFHVGNGPYILSSLEPFVKGVFTPNANYWGGAPKVGIEYQYITDSNVSFQAYKNNEFDIVALPAEDYAAVQADAALLAEAKIYPGSCTTALQFRNFKAPFDDPKVRQAFSHAIDRERWVKDVLQGLGAPTQTWIPPGFPGYKEGETRFGYDAEKAKALIAESTYGSIDKLPPIVLTFGDTPRNRTRNEWLGARMQEVFPGLTVELKPVEPTAFTAAQKDRESELQMFLGGWCADYPDPQNWLSVYWKGTTTFANRIGYKSESFDALIDQADVEGDPAKRSDLYQQAQDQLLNDNPVMFFWNNVNAYMVKPWVKGIVTTPQDSDWPGSTNPLTIDLDTAAMP
jgi:oligopeptide transport system substrate-binding protein